MAATDGGRETSWEWACPYCRATNPVDAVTCGDCGAQLRDPDEDDLFTTVATDNAQVVNLDVPRIRESMWSTEAPPEEPVAEVIEAPHREATEPPVVEEPKPAPGPFSFTGRSPRKPDAPSGPQVFGAGRDSAPTAPAPGGPSAFAPGTDAPNPFAAPAPRAPEPSPAQAPQEAAAPRAEERSVRPTPDPHGLSVAVESLSAAERESSIVPLAVCGALLGDQEVVLGLVAGHLLGHPAVVVLTNGRILVANARRWKPLVDDFRAGPDLTVHLRHDRDIASITLIQGDRLTSVDDISDVAAAMELAERIRNASGS